MVFCFVLSAKSAITVGALIGGSVALYANREAIFDFAATQWEELCREISSDKIKMACNMGDGELSGINDTNEKLSFSDGEATTPDTSDTEEYHEIDGWEDDTDVDLGESTSMEHKQEQTGGLTHRNM